MFGVSFVHVCEDNELAFKYSPLCKHRKFCIYEPEQEHQNSAFWMCCRYKRPAPATTNGNKCGSFLPVGYTVGCVLVMHLGLIKFASPTSNGYTCVVCILHCCYYLGDLLPPLSVLLINIQGSSGE